MFASAWACQDDLIPETDGQQGGITLVFSSSSLATKAPGDGVESLNENKIQTVHYFLFPEDPDDLQTDNRDRQPSHWGVLTNLDAQNEKKITLNISDDDLNNVVFPRPYDECEVYAIVNLPKSIVIDEDTDKTLSNLKAIALDADFVSKATQDLFVMEGIGVAQLDSRTSVKAAEGEIAVDRVAAKLSVNIDVEDEVTYDEKTWRSLPEEMTVTFHNGVSNAVLSGDPAMVTPAYFTQAPQRSFAQSGALWVCEPFYSYPVNWTVGAEEEPYLKIVLPWINEDTGADGQEFTKQYTYYKVILGGESLARNTWYDLTVSLSVLGNFEDFEDNELVIKDMTYKVIDWSTGLAIDTEIIGARYLVVESTSYEINNQETLRIPISTSHDCEIVDLDTKSLVNQADVTRPDYSTETPNMAAPVSWSDDWSLRIVTSETEGTYIEFYHKLNNDITKPPYDYAPYTIDFRVRHKDADGRDIYYRDVHIVQNPAMLITNFKNPGGNIVNDSKTSNDDKGYVFVNGNQLYDGDNWQVVRSCLDGGNNNPNMYIISVTIPYGEYVIADARETEVTSSSTLGLSNNTTSYYYKARSDAESQNVIAPKFRMASSYGKCGSAISKNDAIKRCAAYQEYGYPAGRWRVPTLGEMRFIATLSYDKVIPQLFTSESNYWTSSGAVTYNEKIQLNNNTSAYVRCVYDEWYWENSATPTVDKEVFTWGDAAR